jgi:hypothetical protein
MQQLGTTFASSPPVQAGLQTAAMQAANTVNMGIEYAPTLSPQAAANIADSNLEWVMEWFLASARLSRDSVPWEELPELMRQLFARANEIEQYLYVADLSRIGL